MFMGAVIILLGLAVYSLWERARQKRERWVQADTGTPEPKSSPLSEALVEFVGVSGGIYLALIMLINFLRLTIPERVTVAGMGFDPVAAISVALGILQPFALRLWRKLSYT